MGSAKLYAKQGGAAFAAAAALRQGNQRHVGNPHRQATLAAQYS